MVALAYAVKAAGVQTVSLGKQYLHPETLPALCWLPGAQVVMRQGFQAWPLESPMWTSDFCQGESSKAQVRSPIQQKWERVGSRVGLPVILHTISWQSRTHVVPSPFLNFDFFQWKYLYLEWKTILCQTGRVQFCIHCAIFRVSGREHYFTHKRSE